MLIDISEVGLRADQADGEVALHLTEALEDAGVEHRGLNPRIGADQQNGVGLLDAFDGGVEQISGAAEFWIELRSVLTAVDVGRTKLLGESLQREHLFGSGKIADDCRKTFAVEAAQSFSDGAESLVPGDRLELAVPPEIRPVETLHAQAVPHMARLVRNPFFVDGVVHPRQEAKDLAAAAIDTNVGAERVHDVDRLGLGKFPGPGDEGVGLRGQRTNRAKVHNIAGELRHHAALEIGGDLHVLATANGAKLLDAGDLGHETDAASAVNAAGHVGADQRPQIFVLDRAFVVGEAAGVEAIGHGLVLQVAFATLVADRAVERVIDEQKFEHALARLLHRGRVGDDGGWRAVAAWPEIVDAHGARGHRLRHARHFDQAHPAIAGYRQALVIAETRNLDAGEPAGLDQSDAVRHLVLFAVDNELRHAFLPSFLARRSWRRLAALAACNEYRPERRRETSGTSGRIGQGSQISENRATANSRDAA